MQTFHGRPLIRLLFGSGIGTGLITELGDSFGFGRRDSRGENDGKRKRIRRKKVSISSSILSLPLKQLVIQPVIILIQL